MFVVIHLFSFIFNDMGANFWLSFSLGSGKCPLEMIKSMAGQKH